MFHQNINFDINLLNGIRGFKLRENRSFSRDTRNLDLATRNLIASSDPNLPI